MMVTLPATRGSTYAANISSLGARAAMTDRSQASLFVPKKWPLGKRVGEIVIRDS
jgi:hypothetical protein